MLTQALKTFAHGSNVSGRIRIQDNYHIVQVERSILKVLNDLVDDLTEPPWSCGTPSRHHEPFEKSGGRDERSAGSGITMMNCALVEGRFHVQEAICFPVPTAFVQSVIDTRNRQLTELAKCNKLAIVDGETNTTSFLGDDNLGARIYMVKPSVG